MTPDVSRAPVLVTGGAGFIGRRLVVRLAEAGGRDVIALRRGDEFPFPSGVQSVTADIRSQDDLRAVMPEGAIVVHTAAMTHAGLSVQEPESCFEINAMGTVRVLEAARAAGASGFIFVSTGLVYGIPAYLPVDEQHPTAPLTPYAASKLAAEAAVMAYASNYALPACVLRLSNVYGADGHPDAVHSIILRQTMAGGPVELLDLESVRDFVFVDDVVTGILRVIDQLRPGLRVVANLSAGRGCSIAEFATAMATAFQDQTGTRVEVRQRDHARLSGVRELIFDNRLLESLTGWRPQTSLADGTAATVRALLTMAPGASQQGRMF